MYAGAEDADVGNLATALAGTSAVEEDLIATRRLLTRLDALEGRVSTLETVVEVQGSTIQSLVVGLAEAEAKSRKIKLLGDWSQKQNGWTSLWTAPRIAQWHDRTESEIPDGATLLIVNDAHRYDFLEQVLDLVVRRGDANRLKLVISIRPSGSDYLPRTLATMMDASVVTHFDPLKPLNAEDLLAMAQEALGQAHMQYAQQLAAASHDAPIITVAGGRLIAREEVHPKLLNNRASEKP